MLSWAVTSDSPLAMKSLIVDDHEVKTLYGPYAAKTANMCYCSGVLDALNVGTHSYTIEVADAQGHTANYTGTFEVVTGGIGISRVVVAEHDLARDGVLKSDEPLVLSWAITGDNPLATKSLTVDGNKVETLYGPYAGQNSNVCYCSGVFDALNVGTHQYTIQVADSQGNTTSYSGTFDVAMGSIGISRVVVAESQLPRDGTLTSDEPLVITWSTTSGNPVASQSLTVDGDKVKAIYGPYATGNSNTYNWAGVFDPLTAGAHNYTIQAADKQGHTTNYRGTFNVVTAAPLMVEASALPVRTAQPLTAEQLQPTILAAEHRLATALGSRVLTQLSGVAVRLADLPAGMLGETVGKTILIDRDAAGYGWFVDPTPADDAEFADLLAPHTLAARKGTAADHRADLLTTVMHEMEHVLGDNHSDSLDLMYPTLPLGARRLLDRQPELSAGEKDSAASQSNKPVNTSALDLVFATI